LRYFYQSDLIMGGFIFMGFMSLHVSGLILIAKELSFWIKKSI